MAKRKGQAPSCGLGVRARLRSRRGPEREDHGWARLVSWRSHQSGGGWRWLALTSGCCGASAAQPSSAARAATSTMSASARATVACRTQEQAMQGARGRRVLNASKTSRL